MVAITVSDGLAHGYSLERDGFSGPVKLFTREQCAAILRHWRHVRHEPPEDWRKAWAAVDRLFFDAATRPQLLALLREALGNDIILWGVGVVERPPGRVHEWHTDIESSVGDKFVSVWIGLENTSLESSLKFISGSHRLGKPIQQAAFEHEKRRGSFSDEEALEWARAIGPAARLVQPPTADGEGILFDGRIWHASKNTRASGMRSAILLQYAAADQNVPRPDTSQPEWPFKFFPEPLPVVVVSGTASGKQPRVVAPPPAGRNSESAVAATAEPLTPPLPDDPVKGIRQQSILRGWTPNASLMSAHVSVLSPGRSPHPPHVHVEEEVLIVLDGEAEILLGDSADPAAAKVERVKAGTLAYYPSYQYHTIRNPTDTPITYLMYKWYGPPVEIEGQGRTAIRRFDELLAAQPAKAKQSARFLEHPTAYLEKLEAHVTVLQPGAGYAPHADQHDVAIVLFAGEVRAGDATLRPFGVYYFPAGTMHGMENTGADVARYLVVEFHSPVPEFERATSRAGVTDIRPLARKDKQQKEEKRRRSLGRKLEAGLRWLASPLTRKIERAVDRRLREHFGDDLKEIARLRALLREQSRPGQKN